MTFDARLFILLLALLTAFSPLLLVAMPPVNDEAGERQDSIQEMSGQHADALRCCPEMSTNSVECCSSFNLIVDRADADVLFSPDAFTQKIDSLRLLPFPSRIITPLLPPPIT